MAAVKIHQDVEGFKAGMTVDSTDFPDADRLKWYTGEGYVSTATSRGVDHANKQTVEADNVNPMLASNSNHGASPERVTEGLPATPNSGQNPPEAFDPSKRTIAQVTDYIAQIPEGAGRDAELARIKAVEAKGQNRDGIKSL